MGTIRDQERRISAYIYICCSSSKVKDSGPGKSELHLNFWVFPFKNCCREDASLSIMLGWGKKKHEDVAWNGRYTLTSWPHDQNSDEFRLISANRKLKFAFGWLPQFTGLLGFRHTFFVYRLFVAWWPYGRPLVLHAAHSLVYLTRHYHSSWQDFSQ